METQKFVQAMMFYRPLQLQAKNHSRDAKRDCRVCLLDLKFSNHGLMQFTYYPYQLHHRERAMHDYKDETEMLEQQTE